MAEKKRSNLVDVGRIGSPFGVKGWVKVASYTQPKDNILNYSPWWLKTRHGVKAVEIDDCRYRSEDLIAHIKGIDDRDQAAALSSVSIAIEKSQMAQLAQGEYYWHQLIGMQVVALHRGQEYSLGRVKSLIETGANDVLVIEPCEHSIDDRERLVPYVPGLYVDSVDIESENIRVLWDPDY